MPSIKELNNAFYELLNDNEQVYITIVGNNAHLHHNPERPSMDDASEKCEDIEIHVLEERYKMMKIEYKPIQTKLLSKINQGQALTDEEEEWLDGDGNLVDAEQLIARLTSLSCGSTLKLGSEEARTMRKICEFTPSPGQKNDSKARQELKHGTKVVSSVSGKQDKLEGNGSKNDGGKETKKKVDDPKENKKEETKSNKRKDAESLKPTHSHSKVTVATYSQKVEVLDWYHKNGKNQSKTAVHFGKVYPDLKIKQPLLSKWLKSEDAIRLKSSQSAHESTKKVRQLSYPKVEASLVEWMTQAIHCNMTITGDIIKARWRDFARLAGIPSEEWLKLSGGWLDSFKRRHQLKSYRKHGEAASADITVVESEVERVKEITKDYLLKDIFNMDETGLFYSMPPDTGLAFNKSHGVKGNKTRMTLAVTCNADGTEKLPILFIGKYKRPRCFKKKQARDYGYEYYNNGNAWMTSEIFENWLLTWNSKLRAEKRSILLLVDNFRGHAVPEDGMSNIRVEFFAPNLTSHVQPLDAGIIKSLKSHYRKKAISRSISVFTELGGTTSASDIFNVNQLVAMKMATQAWANVSQATISNCWGKTKITNQASMNCSEKVDKAIQDTNKSIESQLDTLQQIGLVLPVNRMSIEHLLNPDGENNEAARMWSNEEIFELVEEESRQESDAVDNLVATEPPTKRPTKSEMLRHVSQALLYLEDQSEHDNLIANLEEFQQHLLKEIHFGGSQAGIKDYFKVVPNSAPQPDIANTQSTSDDELAIINHVV
ncbi:hypothetical protein MJO29_001978 [Puccinia striiformis f. sp. tritici]|uniref:HTH CENPB-type domain-containing protein n=1 Tax=Puccinia striiformis f. sp. tritici PST-78 TaxID=1165861 RepID=A0A0L0UQ17_9BASI|nr:hypothetical protein MJO29_005996 [Puccinia striiformis f. sp. tritici]KAI7966230.1 hypothetical protein MJO29_001978 [Puccinia striiformis f. sp. tritici]KNE88884.1 hypothetical protein PSTG_17670 [Puccinia striiformis f. sp. tritici PST-78]